MKVSELIELLQRCPQEMDVWAEGCDCEGEARGVMIRRKARYGFDGDEEKPFMVLVGRSRWGTEFENADCYFIDERLEA